MTQEPTVPAPSSNSVDLLLASELELQLEALQSLLRERPDPNVTTVRPQGHLYEALRREHALLKEILGLLP